MTKKHFIALANALKSVRPDKSDYKAWDQWQNTVGAVASVCEQQNAAFNRSTFYKACENE